MLSWSVWRATGDLYSCCILYSYQNLCVDENKIASRSTLTLHGAVSSSHACRSVSNSISAYFPMMKDFTTLIYICMTQSDMLIVIIAHMFFVSGLCSVTVAIGESCQSTTFLHFPCSLSGGGESDIVLCLIALLRDFYRCNNSSLILNIRGTVPAIVCYEHGPYFILATEQSGSKNILIHNMG